MSTLQEAVSKQFGSSAWDLLSDENLSAPAMRKSIGYAVVGSDEIITNRPFDQLKMVMAASQFASDDNECVSVARMVHWLVNKQDILPLVHCHSGFDLASRCLISISLFRGALEWRTAHRGCPPISFYRGAGIKASRNEGLEEVAKHFDNWTMFIGETLGG